jgi:hypothetical protein
LFGGDVMSMGNFSGFDRYKTAALVAASLGAFNLCTPAHADQFSRPPRHRPIVALAQAADDGDRFMAVIDATEESAPATRGLFEHVFLGSFKSDFGSPDASAKPAAQASIVVAEADPYFELWQKNATERVKEESKTVDTHANPLQIAHPDKAVVVCEAGCLTTKDEIVYIAAIVPGVLPAGSLEPTSSDGHPAAAVDEGALPCIAGCYDRPERSRPALDRAAAISAPASRPVAFNASRSALQTLASSPRRNISRNTIRPNASIARAQHRRVLRADKMGDRLQVGVNGAIVEHRQGFQSAAAHPASAKADLAKQNLAKPALTKSVLAKTTVAKTLANRKIATLHAWRTKVVAAKPIVQRPKSPKQAVRRPKHAPQHETYASYDMF